VIPKLMNEVLIGGKAGFKIAARETVHKFRTSSIR
jgi:hypothetical protein